MSEQAKPFSGEEENRPEPGFGLAMLAVVVIILTTAVLAVLIYGLMIAISPLEARDRTPPAGPLVSPRTSVAPERQIVPPTATAALPGQPAG